MPEDYTGLVQTIAILAGVIVYLSREAHRAYRARQNGGKEGRVPTIDPCEECRAQNQDLHNWHSPATDPETGQPIFRWYENNRELAREIAGLREMMGEMMKAMKKYTDALETKASGS